MESRRFLVVAVLFTLFTLPECYKILVFSPTNARSHMVLHGRIADTLAEAGHDVTLFEPDIYSRRDTLVSSKRATILKLNGFSDSLKLTGEFSPFDEPSIWRVKAIFDAYNFGYNKFCEELINMNGTLMELKAANFDAIFIEQFNYCGIAIAHHLGIKRCFVVNSCPLSEQFAYVMGIPTPTSFVPSLYLEEFGTSPTYWQRVRNMFAYVVFVYMGQTASADLDRRLRNKFGNNFPSVDRLVADCDVLFTTEDEFIDLPRPQIPNLIHIGGLAVPDKKIEPIDKEFAAELEKGAEGAVFFSMGTFVNTSTLPAFFMRAITNLARTHPDTHFILRVDRYDQNTREFAKGLPNVYLTEWAPQAEILNHKNLRLFITHAGHNGLLEAARAGIPLICIPLLFDQYKNSFAVESNGWGLRVSRFSLRDEPHLLEKAFDEIHQNQRYKEAAQRISRLIRTKPFQAAELLVKYTEFAIANDGLKELRIEGRNLSFIVYFNLDIIVPFVVIVLLALVISLIVISRACFNGKQVKQLKVE